MLLTLCTRRRKICIFLGLFWVVFSKCAPFMKRMESVTLAFLWKSKLSISVRTHSTLLWNIVVLRLGVVCCVVVLLSRTTLRMLQTPCCFQVVGVRDPCILIFKKYFIFFRQELCLQQVLFLPQEVLHLSRSQEQRLGWWGSFVTLLSFLHLEPYWPCVDFQPPAGTGVPMMPQQPVMYGQPMMRPPFGAATGVQVNVSASWMF